MTQTPPTLLGPKKGKRREGDGPELTEREVNDLGGGRRREECLVEGGGGITRFVRGDAMDPNTKYRVKFKVCTEIGKMFVNLAKQDPARARQNR